ncbi:MAG: hypothetical protein ISS49_07395 [Anaerolineae bacterium]|nr:hypothetical protein [Anaerolineae bacterium]
MMQELELSQVQLDELWTFVRKKERTSSEWEKEHTDGLTDHGWSLEELLMCHVPAAAG